MTGRGWVIAPDRDVLGARWRELIAAPADRKRVLLDEHERDRTIDKALTDNLPGLPTRRKLVDEDDPEPELTDYGYRLLDRELIVADKRVINQPNPGLWQVRDAPGQVYLTALTRHRPTTGPALDATALVPDLHHYQGGYGGRAWPLWLDSAGTRGNVRESVLEALAERLGRAVDASEVFAYVAGIAAHPGFTERFLPEMTTPGLRVPVIADAGLFERVAELGRRTLWLHTFGERFADPSTGRPAGPPRVDNARRPRVREAIPDDPEHHPEEMMHHADEQALAVGAGVIAPVSAAACSYGPGSMPTLARWFSKRQREPEGKGGSPLDEIVRRGWPAAWTTELLNVLNVLELLVDLDAPHRALLDEVLAGPLLDAALFEAADDTPVLLPERPARQARL